MPALARLARGVPAELDELTADAWLRKLGVPARMRRAFWDPFIVSTLNEKPDRVSAHLLGTVLAWGFLASPEDGRLGYPTVDLDTLLVTPALALLERHGGRVVTGGAVRGLVYEGGRVSGVDLADGRSLRADATVLALPAAGLTKVLAGTPLADDPFFARAARITTAPIVSVNVWLDRPLATRAAFEALLDVPIEWVFDRGKMHDRRAGDGHYYTLIVSAAWDLIDAPQAAILEASWTSLRRCYPEFDAAAVRAATVVKHPHATFSGVPGFARLRCPQRTPVTGLFLAGDWTDTGLPSTMEGAVESGVRALAAVTAWLRGDARAVAERAA
jgi:uncharacterized protein with NAD-binding domain and iron-sulfur cluster